jgi:hypothetical protein
VFSVATSKSPADTRLSTLNQFLRRHKFFTRSSFATFTTSERRAFERDVCFFAKAMDLSEEMAKEELSKARKFCREEMSDSDDSAWLNEVDDSSDVSGSHGSRATNPAISNLTEANLATLQSIPLLTEIQGVNQLLPLAKNSLDSMLSSMLSGPHNSSHDRVTKKRKTDAIDVDDHEAKQVVTQRAQSRSTKRAKLRPSNVGDHILPILPTKACDMATELTSGMAEEGPKPLKTRNRRRKTFKAQHHVEATDSNYPEISQKDRDLRNDDPDAMQDKDVQFNIFKFSKKKRPVPEPPSDEAAANITYEAPDTTSEDQQRTVRRKRVRRGKRKDKTARRHAAMKAKSAENEMQATPPEPASPGKENLSVVAMSEAEQDSCSPQDFHSPMI